jgi:o-succinylbenzoate synthase
VTSFGTIVERTGFRVVVTVAENVGVGEAFPLPEFGTEDLDTCAQALSVFANGRRLARLEDALDSNPWLPIATAPCASAALETAFLTALAASRNTRLGALLAREPASEISVQSLLSGATPQALALEAKEALARGTQVLKLKVGARQLVDDLTRVAAVRVAAPRARLRIDANGAWSLERAREALAALAELRIDLCEQPVAARDIDALMRLAEENAVPVAADEALLHPDLVEHILFPRTPIAAIVLKPTALGGPLEAARLAERAARFQISSIVTTLVDGPNMRAMAAEVASAVDSPSGQVHGLDTQRLFERELHDDPYEPQRGRVRCP